MGYLSNTDQEHYSYNLWQVLTVFEQSVNRELPSLNLLIFSNIILLLRKKWKFDPRLLPCNTVDSRLVLSLPISTGQDNLCPKLEGIDHNWPTPALLRSACAVFQEVSRKPEVTNSNKWRDFRKLMVITVKNVINHKPLRKTILWCIGRSWSLRPFIYWVYLFGKIYTLSRLCNMCYKKYVLLCLHTAGPAISIFTVS
jgi:hypothetical protein